MGSRRVTSISGRWSTTRRNWRTSRGWTSHLTPACPRRSGRSHASVEAGLQRARGLAQRHRLVADLLALSRIRSLAQIDVDAEHSELMQAEPEPHHKAHPEPSYHTVTTAKSTPPTSHLVWLVINVPSPTLMANGHVLAEYEFDAKAVATLEHAAHYTRSDKQRSLHAAYPVMKQPIEKFAPDRSQELLKPMHELTVAQKDKVGSALEARMGR